MLRVVGPRLPNVRSHCVFFNDKEVSGITVRHPLHIKFIFITVVVVASIMIVAVIVKDNADNYSYYSDALGSDLPTSDLLAMLVQNHTN